MRSEVRRSCPSWVRNGRFIRRSPNNLQYLTVHLAVCLIAYPASRRPSGPHNHAQPPPSATPCHCSSLRVPCRRRHLGGGHPRRSPAPCADVRRRHVRYSQSGGPSAPVCVADRAARARNRESRGCLRGPSTPVDRVYSVLFPGHDRNHGHPAGNPASSSVPVAGACRRTRGGLDRQPGLPATAGL